MSKLAAIFNVYDGVELLEKSIQQIYDHCDLVIIVYQLISNFGEKWNPYIEILPLANNKTILVKYDPTVEWGGQLNERAKRNLGIDFARDNHCTHFIGMDVDEFYEDFGAYKKLYFESGASGSVCKMQTYFKKPTLMFDRPEDYFVPFIHELHEDTRSGSSTYKFYVDPTRAINQSDVVELPFFMHHFSWVRKDIMRKARNSSAQGIIKNPIIMKDYNSPELGPGYFLANWNRILIEAPDRFGLSGIFE